LDVADKKLTLSVPVTNDSLFGASWSPDGKRVAFGCTDKSVRVIDAASGAQVLFQQSHDDWSLAPHSRSTATTWLQSAAIWRPN